MPGPYYRPPVTLDGVEWEHLRRNKVHEVAEAERFFEQERYDECAQRCYEVLRAEPSEAIRAKCHMYLATEAVGPEQAAGRSYHAAMAIEAWTTVIERTGQSRFPIDKAKVQLTLSKALYDKAESCIGEEDESLQEAESADQETGQASPNATDAMYSERVFGQ